MGSVIAGLYPAEGTSLIKGVPYSHAFTWFITPEWKIWFFDPQVDDSLFQYGTFPDHLPDIVNLKVEKMVI